MSKDSFFNAPIMCYSTAHTNWTFISFVFIFLFKWDCCGAVASVDLPLDIGLFCVN